MEPDLRIFGGDVSDKGKYWIIVLCFIAMGLLFVFREVIF